MTSVTCRSSKASPKLQKGPSQSSHSQASFQQDELMNGLIWSERAPRRLLLWRFQCQHSLLLPPLQAHPRWAGLLSRREGPWQSNPWGGKFGTMTQLIPNTPKTQPGYSVQHWPHYYSVWGGGWITASVAKAHPSVCAVCCLQERRWIRRLRGDTHYVSELILSDCPACKTPILSPTLPPLLQTWGKTQCA